MARLPVVGGDRDNWGVVLNDYLSVEHNANGTLKLRDDGTLSGVVTNSEKGAPSGVATLDGRSKLTGAQLPDGVVSKDETSRVSATADDIRLATALSACSPGDVLDLGGIRNTLSSALTIPAGVKVMNPNFVAGTHTAVHLAAGAELIGGRVTRAATGGSTLAEKSTIVITGNGAKVLGVDVEGAAFANVYANAGLSDWVVSGGTFLNESRTQNACAVYAASAASDNSGALIEKIRLHDDWASPEGILLFNMSRARILGNKLHGLRQLPEVTLTGWVNVSGNIYRTLDRTDGNTRVLADNGVDIQEQFTDSTNPASNTWTITGGYVYLNLGGTNPNTRTITSNVVGGYAITIYSTDYTNRHCNYNLIAYNDIEDCDGFGIYYQLSPASIGNRTQQNHVRSANLTGDQLNDLPFAAVCITRGVRTVCEGDTIEDAGFEGFRVANGATGVSANTQVKGSGGNGFRTQTSGWTHSCDRAEFNTGAGFTCVTASGESHINNEYNGIVAISNGANGFAADNTLGTQISFNLNGGLFRNNTGHGLALVKCSYSNLWSFKSFANSAFQFTQANASSQHLQIGGYIIPSGTSGLNLAGGTEVHLHEGLVATGVTTPFTIGGSVHWHPSRKRTTVLATDADFTITPILTNEQIIHTGTLTAARTITVSSSGAAIGHRFVISRSGGGAFNLNVGTGPLKALATGTWCEITYNGSAWVVTANGSL